MEGKKKNENNHITQNISQKNKLNQHKYDQEIFKTKYNCKKIDK